MEAPAYVRTARYAPDTWSQLHKQEYEAAISQNASLGNMDRIIGIV